MEFCNQFNCFFFFGLPFMDIERSILVRWYQMKPVLLIHLSCTVRTRVFYKTVQKKKEVKHIACSETDRPCVLIAITCNKRIMYACRALSFTTGIYRYGPRIMYPGPCVYVKPGIRLPPSRMEKKRSSSRDKRCRGRDLCLSNDARKGMGLLSLDPYCFSRTGQDNTFHAKSVIIIIYLSPDHPITIRGKNGCVRPTCYQRVK